MAVVRIEAVDYHTAGEPFRIVRSGEGNVPFLPGETVVDRRESAMEPGAPIDAIRKLLVHEPRGHRDMYGGFIVPPNPTVDGADIAHFGVVFWHKDGYSTACGHGTMALGAWALESGLVSATEGVTTVRIDVPSGRVEAHVRVIDGAVHAVEFVNVPSRSLQLDLPLTTSRGEAEVDITWGGAVYASVEASALGLSVTPESYAELVQVGREIKWALNEHPVAQHPDDPRLSGVYGAILWDQPGSDPLHQRNLVVFADGQADRSPCGSGTAARCATLHARGVLRPGKRFVNESIVGTTFIAEVEELGGGEEGVRPRVLGQASHMATSTFVLDERDELPMGFLLG